MRATENNLRMRSLNEPRFSWPCLASVLVGEGMAEGKPKVLILGGKYSDFLFFEIAIYMHGFSERGRVCSGVCVREYVCVCCVFVRVCIWSCVSNGRCRVVIAQLLLTLL